MQATSAAISLGKPVTAPVLVPVLHASTPDCVDEPFMVNGKAYSVTCVSFGAPHGAVFVGDVDSVDVPSLGAALGTHARFPRGASIVFVQALDGETLEARLWQRGESEAASSPEAACVAATAAIMLRKMTRNETDVIMGGDTFRVKWDRGGDTVSVRVL